MFILWIAGGGSTRLSQHPLFSYLGRLLQQEGEKDICTHVHFLRYIYSKIRCIPTRDRLWNTTTFSELYTINVTDENSYTLRKNEFYSAHTQ